MAMCVVCASCDILNSIGSRARQFDADSKAIMLQTSSLARLPADIRLCILSQLPVSQLAQLQPLCQFLHADIAHLWSSNVFLEIYLDRVLARLRAEHQDIVCWYVQDVNGAPQDRERQVGHLLHLLHLMRWLHTCREQLAKPALSKSGRRMSHGSHNGDSHSHTHAAGGFALVKEIYRRVRGARRKQSDLWTRDVQRLLYPDSASTL